MKVQMKPRREPTYCLATSLFAIETIKYLCEYVSFKKPQKAIIILMIFMDDFPLKPYSNTNVSEPPGTE
jgi:hypothetical protein